MAYGATGGASAPAARAASVVDVVPTVLYFLGLPVGRDMDGYARTDLFRPGVHRGAADHVHSDVRAVTMQRSATGV